MTLLTLSPKAVKQAKSLQRFLGAKGQLLLQLPWTAINIKYQASTHGSPGNHPDLPSQSTTLNSPLNSRNSRNSTRPPQPTSAPFLYQFAISASLPPQQQRPRQLHTTTTTTTHSHLSPSINSRIPLNQSISISQSISQSTPPPPSTSPPLHLPCASATPTPFPPQDGCRNNQVSAALPFLSRSSPFLRRQMSYTPDATLPPPHATDTH